MGKVIAFKPKTIGEAKNLPHVLLIENKQHIMYEEYILIGEGRSEEVQIINCDFNKVCDAIEFLTLEVQKVIKGSYNVVDLQRWNQLNCKLTEVLIDNNFKETKRW